MDATDKQMEYLADQVARLEANMIDPREFGRLEAQVEALKAQVADMTTKIDALLELANKSRGGFWGGMAVASSAGAAVAWIVEHLLLRR